MKSVFKYIFAEKNSILKFNNLYERTRRTL